MRILTNYYRPNFEARKYRENISRERIEELLNEGKSTKEVSEICNVSTSYLHALIKTMGIKSYRQRKREKNTDAAINMLLQGRTRVQIGDELGYTKESVSKFVKWGWDKVLEQCGDVKNSREVKMELKKAAVMQDKTLGLSNAAIAEKNGVSIKTVRKYLREINEAEETKNITEKLLAMLNENIPLYIAAESIGISTYKAKKFIASILSEKAGHKSGAGQNVIKEYKTQVLSQKIQALCELGKSVREIARELHITEYVTKKHLGKIR